jgi:hypothetical protein
LLIEDNPARNQEPGERERLILLANRLTEFDGAKPVAGERPEERQGTDDLVATDRVEEAGPTPTNADPRPFAFVIFTKLNAQISDQASLARSG